MSYKDIISFEVFERLVGIVMPECLQSSGVLIILLFDEPELHFVPTNHDDSI